jgi:hypothetical protein
MKKTTFIFLLSLFVSVMNASNNPFYLEINARLFNLDHNSHHYGIELIENGKIRDTVRMQDKGSFSFLVQKNKQYMIRITENNRLISETIIYSRNPEKDQNEGNLSFHEAIVQDGMTQAVISFSSALRNYGAREESGPGINRLLVMAD